MSEFVVEEIKIAPIQEAMDIALALPQSVNAEMRLQQHQYIYTCTEGIQNKRNVVIEGPTGLGKTRALLAATIPFLKEKRENRVLYLTRTITQVDNILRELNDIASLNSENSEIFSSVAVFGARHMNSKAQCWSYGNDRDPEQSCRSCAKNEFWKRVEQVEGISANSAYVSLSKNIGSEQYRKFASATEICPLRLMDFATGKHKCVVAVHQKALDYAWISNRLGSLKNTIVIVDEAHNFLADASSSAFLTLKPGTGRLMIAPDENTFIFEEQGAVQEPTDGIKRVKFKIDQTLKHMFSQFVEIADKMEQLQQKFDQPHLTLIEDCFEFAERVKNTDILGSLNHIEREVIKLNTEDDASGRFKDFALQYTQMVRSVRLVVEKPYEFFIKRNSETGEIAFFAIHPRLKTQLAFSEAHSLIFTSATISPVTDVAMLIGTPEAIKVRIDNVFPEENYKSFFVLGAHSSANGESQTVTFSRDEERTLETSLRTCFNAGKDRNIGVFCSSFRVLDSVIKIIKSGNLVDDTTICIGDIGSAPIFEDARNWLADGWKRAEDMLERDLPKSPKSTDLVKPFMDLQNHEVTTILFGVQGGALAEGVDYKGKAMEMVINIGLPYPATAAEFQVSKIIRDYWGMHFDEHEDFDIDNITYKQEAFRKLAQSAGRGHRSKTDRSVIVFIDERLMGIKNDGFGAYDILSTRNAQRNLQLLQPPLQKICKNVVVDAQNEALKDVLIDMQYAKTMTRMFKLADIISFDAMQDDILEFWGN